MVAGVVPLNTSHSAENICAALKNRLDIWNINRDKIKMFVTDNGANIVKAVKLFF